MYTKPLRSSYTPGTIVQYRDGHYKVKSKEDGLIPLARFMAKTSTKVINGGEDLQKGWRVHHLDMSTYGSEEHDRPENLVVLKCRTTEFKFLKASRIVKEPKPVLKPIPFLERKGA